MGKYAAEDEILETSPDQLAGYLQSKGWRVANETVGKTIVWELGRDRATVWQPLRRETRDYRRLLIELFATLEKVESRPRREILQDVSLNLADVLKFRVGTGLFSSSLPLQNGIVALSSVREIIAAAARSLVDPRPAYYRRPGGKVSQFLRRLRLGQTEIGSYVVTIVSPISSEDPDFARRSIAQVYNSVGAALAAGERLQEEPSMRPFDAAIALGVSANLCDALFELGTTSADEAVEIAFSWSNQGVEAMRGAKDIILGAPVLRRLKSAAEYLREKEPLPNIEIRGFVEAMSDRSEAEKISEIVLAGDFEGSLRKIRFTVEGENRREAIRAFDGRWPVVVGGTLIRKRELFALTDITVLRELKEGEPVVQADDELIETD